MDNYKASLKIQNNKKTADFFKNSELPVPSTEVPSFVWLLFYFVEHHSSRLYSEENKQYIDTY